MRARSREHIVSDAEVERVHANANFGRRSKRSVVDKGVVKALLQFSVGSTMEQILYEHGLVRRARGGVRGKPLVLTKKGLEYARDLFYMRKWGEFDDE